MLIATTEGLTLAITEIKSGNSGFPSSAEGSVHSGSAEAVMSGDEELGGGDEVSIEKQPVPRERDRIRTRQINRYFIFTRFITDLIVAQGQSWRKKKENIRDV